MPDGGHRRHDRRDTPSVWKASHTRNATMPMLRVGDDRIYGDHGLTSTNATAQDCG